MTEEIKCPMQRNAVVTEEWCELVQNKTLCDGCTRNQGRDKSKYQEERDNDRRR